MRDTPETAPVKQYAGASAAVLLANELFVWRDGDAYDVEIVDYH